MNYNQWGGKRGRGRGRGWRGGFNPRGGPHGQRGNPRGGYRGPPPDFSQLYPLNLNLNEPPWLRLRGPPQFQQSLLFRRPLLSPPRSSHVSPQRPASPLPGSEEYMQRNISEKSAFLKRELELEPPNSNFSNSNKLEASDGGFSSDTASETPLNNDVQIENQPVQQIVTETAPSPRRTRRQTQRQMQDKVMSVEEIHDKIMNHISNLSLGKKMNLVNQARPTGYDIAIQQITRQKRLELSKALRDMCNNKFKETESSSEVINSIIPDFDIKIEELPRELVEQLSSTLNEDVEERIQNMYIDPEALFQQAADMLNTSLDDIKTGDGLGEDVLDSVGCEFGDTTLDANISQNIEDSSLSYNDQSLPNDMPFEETMDYPMQCQSPPVDFSVPPPNFSIAGPLNYPHQSSPSLMMVQQLPMQFPNIENNLSDSFQFEPISQAAENSGAQYYSPEQELSNSNSLQTPVYNNLMMEQDNLMMEPQMEQGNLMMEPRMEQNNLMMGQDNLMMEPQMEQNNLMMEQNLLNNTDQTDMSVSLNPEEVNVLTNACNNLMQAQNSGQFFDINAAVDDILLPPGDPPFDDLVSTQSCANKTDSITNTTSDVLTEAAALEAALLQSDLDLRLLELSKTNNSGLSKISDPVQNDAIDNALNGTEKAKPAKPVKKVKLRRWKQVEPPEGGNAKEKLKREKLINKKELAKKKIESETEQPKIKPIKINRSLIRNLKDTPSVFLEQEKPESKKEEEKQQPVEQVKAKVEQVKTKVGTETPPKDDKVEKEKCLQKLLASTASIKKTLPEKLISEKTSTEVEKTSKSKDRVEQSSTKSKSRSKSIENEDFVQAKEDKRARYKEKDKRTSFDEEPTERRKEKSKAYADMEDYNKARFDRSRYDMYQAEKDDEEYRKQYKDKTFIDEERQRQSNRDKGYEKYHEKYRSPDSEHSETYRFSKYHSEREERHSKRYYHDQAAYAYRAEYMNFPKDYAYNSQKYVYPPEYYSRQEPSSYLPEEYEKSHYNQKNRSKHKKRSKKHKRHREESYSSESSDLSSDKESSTSSQRKSRRSKYSDLPDSSEERRSLRKPLKERIQILTESKSRGRASSVDFDENRKIKSEPVSPESSSREPSPERKRAKSIERCNTQKGPSRAETQNLAARPSSAEKLHSTTRSVPFTNKPCPSKSQIENVASVPFTNKPCPSKSQIENVASVPFTNKPCPSKSQIENVAVRNTKVPSPAEKLQQPATPIVPFANKPCPSKPQIENVAVRHTKVPSPAEKLQHPATPIVPFANKPYPSKKQIEDPLKEREEMILKTDKVPFRAEPPNIKKPTPEEKSKLLEKEELEAVKELPNIDNIAKIISNLSTIVQTEETKETVAENQRLRPPEEPKICNTRPWKSPGEKKFMMEHLSRNPTCDEEELDYEASDPEAAANKIADVSFEEFGENLDDQSDANKLDEVEPEHEERLLYVNPEPTAEIPITTEENKKDDPKSLSTEAAKNSESSTLEAIKEDEIRSSTPLNTQVQNEPTVETVEALVPNNDNIKPVNTDENKPETEQVNSTSLQENSQDSKIEQESVKSSELSAETKSTELLLTEKSSELPLLEKSSELPLPEKSSELPLPKKSSELPLPEKSSELPAETKATELLSTEKLKTDAKVRPSSKDRKHAKKSSRSKSRSRSNPRELLHSAEVSSTSDAAKAKIASANASKSKSRNSTPLPNNDTKTDSKKEQPPKANETNSSHAKEKMLVTTYTQTLDDSEKKDSHRKSNKKDPKKDKKRSVSPKVEKSKSRRSISAGTQTSTANANNSTQTPIVKCKNVHVQLDLDDSKAKAKKTVLVQTEHVVIIDTCDDVDVDKQPESTDKSGRKILKAARRRQTIQRMFDLDKEIERLTKLRQTMYKKLNDDSDESDTEVSATKSNSTASDHLSANRKKRKRKLDTPTEKSPSRNSQHSENKRTRTSRRGQHLNTETPEANTSKDQSEKAEKVKTHRQRSHDTEKTNIKTDQTIPSDDSELKPKENSETKADIDKNQSDPITNNSKDKATEDTKTQSMINEGNLKPNNEDPPVTKEDITGSKKDDESQPESNSDLSKIADEDKENPQVKENDSSKPKDDSSKPKENRDLKITIKTSTIREQNEEEPSDAEIMGRPTRSRRLKAPSTSEDTKDTRRKHRETDSEKHEESSSTEQNSAHKSKRRHKKTKTEDGHRKTEREDSSERDTSVEPTYEHKETERQHKDLTIESVATSTRRSKSKSRKKSHRSKSSKRSKEEKKRFKIIIKSPVPDPEPEPKSEDSSKAESVPSKRQRRALRASADVSQNKEVEEPSRTVDDSTKKTSNDSTEVSSNKEMEEPSITIDDSTKTEADITEDEAVMSSKSRRRERSRGESRSKRNTARKSRSVSHPKESESVATATEKEASALNSSEEGSKTDTQKTQEVDQQDSSVLLGFKVSESNQQPQFVSEPPEETEMADKINGNLSEPQFEKQKKRKRSETADLDSDIGTHKKKPKKRHLSGIMSGYKSKRRKSSETSHRRKSMQGGDGNLPNIAMNASVVRIARFSLSQLEEIRESIRSKSTSVSEDAGKFVPENSPIKESEDEMSDRPPDVKEAETKPREVSEPEAKPLKVREPEAKPSKVSEPEAKPLKVREPEAKPSKVSEPEAKSPEVREPEAKSPEVREPETETSDGQPEVKEPEPDVQKVKMEPVDDTKGSSPEPLPLEATQPESASEEDHNKVDTPPDCEPPGGETNTANISLETSNEAFEDFVKEKVMECNDEPPVLTPEVEEVRTPEVEEGNNLETPDWEDFEVVDEDDDYAMDFKGFNGAILVIKVIASTALAASDKGKILCFNMLNGDLVNTFEVSKLAITSMVVIKRNETNMVYTGSLDSCIGIVNFDTKDVVKIEKLTEPVQCMEYAWNFVFIGSDRGSLIRFDLNTEKVADAIKISDFNVLMMKATQEGPRKVLVIATRNAPVCVRDACSGLLLRTMQTPFSPTVYTLLFDKNLIYCGTSQHDILVYTFEDGQLIFKHEATKSKGVVCMQIVGNLLFAGCYNGNIYVYNTKTNVHLGTMNGPGGLMLSMEIVRNKIIVGTKSSNFRAWRIPQKYLDQI